MVMRVTQRNMYSNVVTQMNYTLSQLMESNIQAASEKRINKPSDDPVGMTRVLGYRSSLDQIEQYASNISQATGWLNLADNTLIQVNTVVTNLKELAEQAATGTLTDENREQISYEARQLFEQLLSLSNTSYQDNSIFAGQKTSAPAYQESLAVMTPADADDANFFDSSRYVETISGELDATVALTFVSDSSAPGTTVTLGDGAAPADLMARYSLDGGKTWQTQAIAADQRSITIGGAQIDFRQGTPVNLSSADPPEGNPEGTLLWIAPTARYMGDDENQTAVEIDTNSTAIEVRANGSFEQTVRVSNLNVVADPSNAANRLVTYDLTFADGTSYSSSSTIRPGETPAIQLPQGQVQLIGGDPFADPAAYGDLDFTIHAGSVQAIAANGSPNAFADGVFTRDVVVRIDAACADVTTDPISYSYSLDGGNTWVTGNTADNGSYLAVPGGFMHLTDQNGQVALDVGDQFTIHPKTASRYVDIGQGSQVTINNIGKNIFGGVYGTGSGAVFSETGQDQGNLFQAAGKLVAALETNSQSGCQEALDELRAASQTVLNRAADVGGRENRLTTQKNILENQAINNEDQLSAVEDVDLAALMTRLSQQELAYQAVLKSSSMIMQLSLVNMI